jgi:hypothetical protein
MIDNTILKIFQLSLPVATILATAWVAVDKAGWSAFYLFIGGFIFTIVLRIIEQTIFADNCSHGRYYRMGN